MLGEAPWGSDFLALPSTHLLSYVWKLRWQTRGASQATKPAANRSAKSLINEGSGKEVAVITADLQVVAMWTDKLLREKSNFF